MIVILSAAAAILLSHERAIADLRACDGEQKVEIRMLSENVNEMRIDVKELLRRIPRISENSP
jgi:hypothetical protein